MLGNKVKFIDFFKIYRLSLNGSKSVKKRKSFLFVKIS